MPSDQSRRFVPSGTLGDQSTNSKFKRDLLHIECNTISFLKSCHFSIMLCTSGENVFKCPISYDGVPLSCINEYLATDGGGNMSE